MKKIFLLLMTFVLTQVSANAIQWEEVRTLTGNLAYLDVDSITEYKNNYFYNVKVPKDNDQSNYVVITMQSSKNSGFSKRLKAYSLSDYQMLNGDYANITNLQTKDLEAVLYKSTVYSCFKRVKEITNKTKMDSQLVIE